MLGKYLACPFEHRLLMPDPCYDVNRQFLLALHRNCIWAKCAKEPWEHTSGRLNEHFEPLSLKLRYHSLEYRVIG